MAFTYFFRDLQTLEHICTHVLPLIKTKSTINIWDAGCATGHEPYSLAILLKENMGKMTFRNVKIFASDIDESNLFHQIITKGIYPFEQIQRIPEYYREKYFSCVGNGNLYQIDYDLKKAITYIRHDLLTLKPVIKKCSLILCKNVLLHLKAEERIQVLQMFYSSLSDNGFLATEQTQKIPQEISDMFIRVVPNTQLFRKAG